MLSKGASKVKPEQLRVGILVALVLVALIFFWTQIPNYFAPRPTNRMLVGITIPLVVAVGQTFVVLTRNIDLSVGSIVGLSAYVTGTELERHNDMARLLVVLLAVAIGMVLGMINGALVAYGGVPAVITTLGTLALYRVFLVEISGAKTVTTANLPDWLNDIPGKAIVTLDEYELRLVVAMALLVAIAGQLVLSYLPYGRRIYAIGSNPEAAKMTGLPVKRDVFLAFTISGALAGLGGFFWLVRFGNITVEAAQGFELQVVAAVVVGGVSIFGGSGTIVGVLLGVLLIEILQQSLLRWSGVSEFVKDAVLGLLILIAVTADAVILRKLRDFWAATRRRDQAQARAVEAGSAADAS